MAEAIPSSETAPLPARSSYLIIFLAWLIPGAGHLLLGRRGRGAIVLGTVLLTFVVGLLMHGPMFQPHGGDLLSTLIQYGGFLGDLCSGILYLLAVWLGYNAPDVAAFSPDYGQKFLVAAGLLNILAIVDAYEIATKQKD
ncbi:MAG TPA: DUF6677 family protein [Bryobacteraceae bacterium]|nr:DUF6677 family protein [Bryobacteraceae bacterium]